MLGSALPPGAAPLLSSPVVPPWPWPGLYCPLRLPLHHVLSGFGKDPGNAAVAYAGVTLSIVDSQLDDHTGPSPGASVAIIGASAATLRNSVFNRARSNQGGGAVYAINVPSGGLTIDGCTFTNCRWAGKSVGAAARGRRPGDRKQPRGPYPSLAGCVRTGQARHRRRA